MPAAAPGKWGCSAWRTACKSLHYDHTLSNLALAGVHVHVSSTSGCGYLPRVYQQAFARGLDGAQGSWDTAWLHAAKERRAHVGNIVGAVVLVGGGIVSYDKGVGVDKGCLNGGPAGWAGQVHGVVVAGQLPPAWRGMSDLA